MKESSTLRIALVGVIFFSSMFAASVLSGSQGAIIVTGLFLAISASFFIVGEFPRKE